MFACFPSMHRNFLYIKIKPANLQNEPSHLCAEASCQYIHINKTVQQQYVSLPPLSNLHCLRAYLFLLTYLYLIESITFRLSIVYRIHIFFNLHIFSARSQYQKPGTTPRIQGLRSALPFLPEKQNKSAPESG